MSKEELNKENLNKEEEELVEFGLEYEQSQNSSRPNMNGQLLYNLFKENGSKPLNFTIRSISQVKDKKYNNKVTKTVYVNLYPNEDYAGKVFVFDEEGNKKTKANALGTEEPVIEDGVLSYFLDQIKFTRNAEDSLEDLDLSLKSLVLHETNVGFYLTECIFQNSGDIEYGKVKSNVIKFSKEYLDANQDSEINLCVVKRQNSAGYKPSIILCSPERYVDLLKLKNFS